MGEQKQDKVDLYVQEGGWVIVGREVPPANGEANPLWVNLSPCATVRIWGTDAGLGQLAKEGPLQETKLDNEPGPVRLNLDYTLRIIPCDINKWQKWVKAASKE